MALDKTIRIKVESGKAKAKVDSLDNSVGRLDKTAEKTNKSFFNLKKSVIAVGLAISAGAIAKYADQFTSIQNQIRQTTNSTEGLTKSTAQLLQISNRARVDFASTADLYTQLTLSTEKLNLSTEEQLRLTETISKSFSVSGKSAAESAGAIRQLGQAFAAGALRGDEFNSIAENAPEIMRALQRSLNITQGELRDLAATGGITAEILVDALGQASDVIDKKLNESTRTFAQSLVVAENNVTAFIGSSDFIAASMESAGDAIVFLSENLGFLSATGSKFDGIAKDINFSLETLNETIAELFEDIEVDGEDTISSITSAFSDMPNNIRAFIQIAVVEVLSFFSMLSAEAESAKDHILAIFGDETFAGVEKRRIESLKLLEGAREDSISAILLERDAAIKSSDEQIKKAKELTVENKKSADIIVSPTKKASLAPSSDFKNTEKFKTENLKSELQERRRMQIEFNKFLLQDFASAAEEERAIVDFNQQAELIQLEKQRELSATEFEKRREAILINDKLTSEAKLALGAELQIQELTQLEIFETQKTEIEQDSALDREEIARAEAEAKRNILLSNSDAVLGAISALGEKSIKVQKAVSLTSSGIAIATGIARAQELGFPANISEIARVVAVGAKVKSAINGASVGGQVSVGGVGSTPISAGTSDSQPQRQEPINQSNVVEFKGLSEVAEALRNLDQDEAIPVEFAQRIVAGIAEVQRIGGKT